MVLDAFILKPYCSHSGTQCTFYLNDEYNNHLRFQPYDLHNNGENSVASV